ncbi:MAG: class I SAM-dependent methyltransferase, partial [Candidatus Dormibacteraeota bacterium]|nr:class I SAM-dependent methyltransferase [Candidatus Dormibacteraeota bacterium]
MKARELYPAIFSRHAEAYRARHREISSHGRLAALELLAAQPGELVLDLACGPGNMTRRLALAGARVVGVDLAPGMLALAAADVPEAAFARMDLERLALGDSAFDGAFCGHGLQFVADLVGALAEAPGFGHRPDPADRRPLAAAATRARGRRRASARDRAGGLPRRGPSGWV